ncbi:MAG: TetR/AcrR family transcriptional regulator [Carboxylicivirga sp.]|jgi:AcrR family transcriptional regulator|nr:TetR/AcrR family transcriptional regulator [Carboxylicivirga sp.]
MKETKTKILQSAITTWGKDLSATLDDIAGNLGISRRTLHRHYSGRDELMDSVFNFIINEYLFHLKKIIDDSPNDKDRLKAFLKFDINSAKKYMVFCQVRKEEYPEVATENENFIEMYSIYVQVFERLLAAQQISKDLSIQWMMNFYLSIVEASDKLIDNGLDKDECFQMAWQSFWNGIKSENE